MDDAFLDRTVNEGEGGIEQFPGELDILRLDSPTELFYLVSESRAVPLVYLPSSSVLSHPLCRGLRFCHFTSFTPLTDAKGDYIG